MKIEILSKVWFLLQRRLLKLSCSVVGYASLFAFTLLFVPAVEARESRGCHGVIYAIPGEIVGTDGNVTFGRGHSNPYADTYRREHEEMVLIDGTGYCRLGQENKKCRKVAADAALKCAREIWDKRWNRVVPNNKCGNDTNAKIRAWAPDETPEIQSSLRGDIKTTIEFEACCRTARTAQSLSLVVGYKSYSSHDDRLIGGEGRRNARAEKACSRTDLFSTNYEVDCDQLKDDGLLHCPEIPDSKPLNKSEESRRTPGSAVGGGGNSSAKRTNPVKDESAKRTNPFKIKSAQISLIKFPPLSDAQQCPRKVMIRTTFVTNKKGTVRFKLHRSHKPGEPYTHRAVAKKIGGTWKAVHERVITVNKSINRSFMAETINKKVKVRATPWEKLVIRCNQGHSGSGDFGFGK